jgi:hypothetical protein
MRRTAVTIVALLALAVPQAAQAADGSVVLAQCDRTGRAAEFEGRMQSVQDAAELRMRFTLQARRGGRRGFRRVAAPGFGVWTAADPGTTRYVFTRRVEQLIGPARYRVVVHFRWLAADGRIMARDRAVSRSCKQRDTRPNLRVERVTAVQTADPASRRYEVLLVNDGRGDAEPFELAVAGLDPVIVDGLDARSERFVEVLGPACSPSLPLVAVVDPGDLIDERFERDNRHRTSC